MKIDIRTTATYNTNTTVSMLRNIDPFNTGQMLSKNISTLFSSGTLLLLLQILFLLDIVSDFSLIKMAREGLMGW